MRLLGPCLAAFLLLAVAVLPATANADPGSSISFADSSTDFGDVGIQATKSLKLKLTNNSPLSSVLSDPTLSGADADQFSVDGNSCGGSLDAMSSCEISVAFKPTRAGAASAAIELVNDGTPSPVSEALVGNGVAPQLSLPGSLDFGTVVVNRDNASQSVLVQNSGNVDTTIQSVSIVGTDASAFSFDYQNCSGQMLPPGAGCGLQVRFNPQQGRTYSATLRIVAGDTQFDVPLGGLGGLSHVTPSPASLDFGSLTVGQTATRSISFTNDGNIPFQTIVSLLAGGDVGSFSMMTDGCSLAEVPPGTSCTMTVRFTPTAVGAVQARLLLIGGNDQPLAITVSGSAVAAPTDASQPEPGSPNADASGSGLGGPVRAALARRHPSSARYRDGRVRLGAISCVGAPACRVSAQTRYVVDTTRGIRVVAGESRSWTPAGQRVSVPVPPLLRGQPVRLLLTLTTTSWGHETTTQTRVFKLAASTR